LSRFRIILFTVAHEFMCSNSSVTETSVFSGTMRVVSSAYLKRWTLVTVTVTVQSAEFTKIDSRSQKSTCRLVDVRYIACVGVKCKQFTEMRNYETTPRAIGRTMRAFVYVCAIETCRLLQFHRRRATAHSVIMKVSHRCTNTKDTRRRASTFGRRLRVNTVARD